MVLQSPLDVVEALLVNSLPHETRQTCLDRLAGERQCVADLAGSLGDSDGKAGEKQVELGLRDERYDSYDSIIQLVWGDHMLAHIGRACPKNSNDTRALAACW